jgi:hypothetical protein
MDDLKLYTLYLCAVSIAAALVGLGVALIRK